MNLLHGVGDFFSLDIGTNSLRLLQLNGDQKRGWSLAHYAYMPVDSRVILDDSEVGRKKLSEAIARAVLQGGFNTKNVAVGLPADKTFTSIVEVENRSPKDLEKTIKYELDQYIPMAIEEAEVDWVPLGISPNDPKKLEILISSTSKDFAERTLEVVEAANLEVIAQEPEPIAMARALMNLGAPDAQMVIDLGERSTDLVVIYQNAPRLVRSIPGGLLSLCKTVSMALNVRDDQARQFILKFGLAQDKVEGEVFKALGPELDIFAQELSKSVRFFQTKYVNSKVGNIVVSGFAGVIPFFAEYIEAKINIPTTQGNPWQAVRVTPEQQQALSNVANEFAVAIGLAERGND